MPGKSASYARSRGWPVDRARANYHFGAKQALIERRGARLSEVRLRRRAKMRRAAEPGRPSKAAALSALLDPILDVLGHPDPGWHHSFALLATVSNSPPWGKRLVGH